MKHSPGRAVVGAHWSRLHTPTAASSVLGQYVAPRAVEKATPNLIDQQRQHEALRPKESVLVSLPVEPAHGDHVLRHHLAAISIAAIPRTGRSRAPSTVCAGSCSTRATIRRFRTPDHELVHALQLHAVPLLPPERLLQPGGQGRLSDLRVSEVGGSQPSGTVPGTVTNVTASVSGTSATVSWSAVSGATGYYVQRIADDGSGATEFTTSYEPHPEPRTRATVPLPRSGLRGLAQGLSFRELEPRRDRRRRDGFEGSHRALFLFADGPIRNDR